MDRSTLMILVMFFVLMESVFGETHATSAKIKGNENVELSQEQLGKLSNFLTLLKRTQTKVVEILKDEPFNTTLSSSMALVVQEGSESEESVIVMDRLDGKIFSYSMVNADARDSELERLTVKDAIPSDKAFEIVLPILKYYELSLKRDDYTIAFKDKISITPGDLWGCRWFIEKEFTYEGMPCREKGIRISLLPYSGRIAQILYKPVVVPKVPKCKISESEARESAKKAAAKSVYLPNVIFKNESARTVIANKNGHFFKDKKEMLKALITMPESFYCWEVPITFTQHDGHSFDAYIWVNVENGEVIGGSTGLPFQGKE